MLYKKITCLFLMLMLLFSTLAGCGKKASDTAAPAYNNKADGYNEAAQNGAAKAAAPANSASVSSEAAGADTGNAVQSSQKVIYTGTVSMETLNFDSTLDQVYKYVDTIQGYVEKSNVQEARQDASGKALLRTASFTFRIPVSSYNQFFVDLKQMGNILSQSSNGEDITGKYYDTEARLNAQKVKEERILALLQKADKLSDILDLERELSNVRYQIDNFAGTLKKWDNQVEYSTVNLNIKEVQKLEENTALSAKGLGGRITRGFRSSVKALWSFLQGLVVFIAVILPFAAASAVLLLLVLFVRRVVRRVRQKEN